MGVFISYSCLIALARSYSTTLNRSNEKRYTYLVFDFERKAFSPSPLSMMLVVGLFVYVLYQVEDILFYVDFVGCFYQERILDFANVFSVSNEKIIQFCLVFC